jgi:hypothetical protein
MHGELIGLSEDATTGATAAAILTTPPKFAIFAQQNHARKLDLLLDEVFYRNRKESHKVQIVTKRSGSIGSLGGDRRFLFTGR